ncbi:hypothetical protein TanjilG_09909 [Lupinus angustifolius]|uniref:Uncharacterized protein n=1 Tax=Lupinus angustifolius TaxID=3871 RepID=A0A1J7GD06_LUPAN|nr:hypothetical protein TanjilG_09909 [Lupinus angustifolius]
MRLRCSKGSQCPQMRGFTVLVLMENIRTMDRAIEAKGISKIATDDQGKNIWLKLEHES